MHSGVGFNLQRRVIRPRDVQPPGHAHDVWGAVGFALLSGGFVLCRIPRLGDLLSIGVQRNVGIVALWRSDHSKAPVFGDDRNPVAGHIDRRRILRRFGGGATRLRGKDCGKQQQYNRGKEQSSHLSFFWRVV